VLIYAALPTLGFRTWAALVLSFMVALLILYFGSIALSWRASRLVQPPGPWWSRWYGIVAVLAVEMAVGWAIPDATLGYKSFYLPAESMTPTLAVNDRLVARMRVPAQLRRGTIVLLRVGHSIYIKRIAALAGDRIAMRAGVVILNGRPVPQRLLGQDQVPPSIFGTAARRLAEQFPGETQPHQIYDLGYSPFDDMAEVTVAPGHVFVLGDNRDQSADSRVPRDEMGIEQAPVGDIAGVAQFIFWSGDRSRIGTRLDD
jgi:signal peptidase I